MNIRKNIDYSDMYAALDAAISAEKQQMKLYCKIGKAVCQRCEKGAAVAAAAYLRKQSLRETFVECGISTALMRIVQIC